MQEQKNKHLIISTALLLLLHLIGIIGISSSYHEPFLALTPVNLLISFGLLLLNHKQFNNSFFLFILVTFLAGFFIEVAGVKTGLIFGNYAYGETLGLKFLDVPLIIGINWVMLIYSAGTIVNRIKAHAVVKSLIAALLLVGLDLFIEPVAIKFDFWSWQHMIIPVRNYIGWFITAFILSYFFCKLNVDKQNPLSLRLILIQFVFFAVMCFI